MEDVTCKLADCEEGLYRPNAEVVECVEIPACPDGEHRDPIDEVDPDTGLIPCVACPDGEVWNEDDALCESACAGMEGFTWNTESENCEPPNECLFETYFYDETCVTSEDDECMWY